MKVKILLTMLLFVTTVSVSAQETKSSCNLEYSVIAEKNSDGLGYEDRFVNFKWDISKLNASDEISIEVVKIFDCFTGINGIQTENYRLLNLKDKDLSNKNSLKIKHIEMIAKCFKWRVILKSDNCLERSDWNYYTFMD